MGLPHARIQLPENHNSVLEIYNPESLIIQLNFSVELVNGCICGNPFHKSDYKYS